MLIIGTIIGAGFASGREIVSFFGSDISPLVAPLCGAVIFVLSVLFLTAGAKINATNIGEVNVKVAGKLHACADIFLLVNSLIVLSGMLAGMDSLGNMVLPIAPAYSVVSGVLCMLVVLKGMKGLLNCNSVIVPVIIAAMILVCSLSFDGVRFEAPFSGFTLLTILVYISMNMMLASTVLTTMGKLSFKTILISSGIAATVMSLLMLLIINGLNGSGTTDAAMPVLMLAKKISPVLFGLMVGVIAISIFTTMMTAMAGLTGWLDTLIGDKKYTVLIVFLAGLILSNLGFENVVAYLYPLIGVIGAIYIFLVIMFVARKSPLAVTLRSLFHKRDDKIHKRRKDAKNQG